MWSSKKYNSIISEIRNLKFHRHKATLRRFWPQEDCFGPITVIDWRRPGTCAYAVRYVCDGYHIYITGDLGEAIFELTWNADEHAFDEKSLNYLYKKLLVSSVVDRAMTFDAAHAAESIRSVYSDEEDQFVVDLCAKGACSCFDLQEWIEWLYENKEMIEKRLSVNWFETLPNIGSVYCQRFLLWVTGLQMASEQLKRAVEEGTR